MIPLKMPAMTPRLAECTDIEVAKLARDPRSVVILPLGAIEDIARRLPQAWIDVQRTLATGRTTFRKMNPRGRGYFGWPAAASEAAGRKVMVLRGRLIARDRLSALRAWPRA